jgi:hypothetical protein
MRESFGFPLDPESCKQADYVCSSLLFLWFKKGNSFGPFITRLKRSIYYSLEETPELQDVI